MQRAASREAKRRIKEDGPFGPLGKKETIYHWSFDIFQLPFGVLSADYSCNHDEQLISVKCQMINNSDPFPYSGFAGLRAFVGAITAGGPGIPSFTV